MGERSESIYKKRINCFPNFSFDYMEMQRNTVNVEEKEKKTTKSKPIKTRKIWSNRYIKYGVHKPECINCRYSMVFGPFFLISEHFFFSLHLAVVNLVPVYIIIYFSAFRMDTVKCDTINFNDVVISSYS